jgi:hypothetical protein
MVDQMNEAEAERIAAGSFRHRDQGTVATACGCLYCFATFPNGEIQAWVDYGRTALSSRCGIDAVLPDVIDDASLRSLHHHRFTVAYRLDEAAMTVRAAGE